MEEPELTHDEELKRATDRYDIVIDVHGLGALKSGWGIYGSPDSKDRIGSKRGRVVAIFGHFKVGKTWIANKLMEDDSSLVDHEIIPTLGISMKIKKSKNQGSIQTKSVPTSTFRKGFGHKPPTSTKPSAESNEIIILDTQGTNSPAAVNMLNDVRATEVFLRQMALEFAQRSILVIGEFDKNAQVEIEVLLKQLENKHKPATSSNRLIIIHNYKTIDVKAILEKKIEDIERVYNGQWEVIKQDSLIINGGPFTTHLFFVMGSEGWCTEHNNKVAAWLLSLIDKDQLNDLFLIKKFEEIGTHLLGNFIKDWDETFMLQASSDNSEINPVIFSPPERDNDNGNNDEDVQKEYTPLTEEQRTYYQAILDDKNNDFELQDLEFNDVGVTSSTRVVLKGSVIYNEQAKKFIVAIMAPGFNPDHKNGEYIKYKFQGHHKIMVWLKLDKLDLPEAEGFTQQYSDVKYGSGMFEYKFPHKQSFKWPETKEMFYESIKVYNGQVLLFLDQECMAC